MQVLLVQLPIPKSNFGIRTGNIPFGAACLKQAACDLPDVDIHILPQRFASHAGDARILDEIIRLKPDILGFTVFCWNRERSVYLAEHAKEAVGCTVIFGGPEITPDTPGIHHDFIDHRIYGQGECHFKELLSKAQSRTIDGKGADLASGRIFETRPSPYTEGTITAYPGDPFLLETQRGCPYGCRFCNYNKSAGKLIFKDPDHIASAMAWARAQGVPEMVFLDPTLNARPDLEQLLLRIRDLNPEPRIPLSSELRAELIDEHTAQLLRDAGFTEFEIGLQSIHPHVLEQMGRRTHLKAFLSGVNTLKARGICPRIDLIAGLPGDTLEGFLSSLDFVIDNGLAEDIQVFPLLVLPGTYFRKHSDRLGLEYDPHPPYTLRQTPTFSSDDMVTAFDAAEERLDLALLPMPHLDIGFREEGQEVLRDSRVETDGRQLITKVNLDSPRSIRELEAVAGKLSSPYQVFIHGEATDTYLEAIRTLSTANPFTPLEIVFVRPGKHPDIPAFLEAVQLKRPHFLDKDLELLFPPPGNRAVLFTLVSRQRELFFAGEMMRQVYHWQHEHLPTGAALDELSHLDGILIDSPATPDVLKDWQDRHSPGADSLPLMSFSGIALQNRWKKLTAGDEWEV
ncbi:MAG: radical SAM protein [Desulfobacterales bacterium]|nr:radical SAM protein [Desulfobacterales bacterium]